MSSSRSDKQYVAAELRRLLAQKGYRRKRRKIPRAWDPAIADLDIPSAAAAAGMERSATLRSWATGRSLPGHGPSDPALFWAVIERLGLDSAPFQGRIPATRQEKGIWRVCRDCGEVKWMPPSAARKLKAKLDWEKREARGLCRRCNSRRMMRESKVLREAAYRNVQPKRLRILRSQAKLGDLAARRELAFSISRGRPFTHRSPEAARAAAGRPQPGHAIQALLADRSWKRRRLGLCPLCNLLVQHTAYRPLWMKGVWHPPCLNTWTTHKLLRRVRGGSRRPPFFLPPAPPKRGRPFAVEHLSRNLLAFLRHRADVMGYRGGCSIRQSADLAEKIAFPTLYRQLKNVVRLLPGDWKLVLRTLRPAGYQSLQKLFQLPDRLRETNKAGKRDDLVRWLSDHGMAAAEVSRITGVLVPRILDLRRTRAPATQVPPPRRRAASSGVSPAGAAAVR